MFKTIKHSPTLSEEIQEMLAESNIKADYVFKDVNMNFGQSDSEFVYDAQAVIQAFLILLSVPRNSRWWRPEYGVPRLLDLLFEPFDMNTADQIVSVIQLIAEQAQQVIGLVIDSSDIKMDYATSTYVVLMEISIPRLEIKGEPISFGLQKQG